MYDSLFDRLQALVRVDLSQHTATVTIRGSFTTTNYRGLLPVIRRAHALPGAPLVRVDLTHATRVHPAAVGLLEADCRALFPGVDGLPVRVVGTPGRTMPPLALNAGLPAAA